MKSPVYWHWQKMKYFFLVINLSNILIMVSSSLVYNNRQRAATSSEELNGDPNQLILLVDDNINKIMTNKTNLLISKAAKKRAEVESSRSKLALNNGKENKPSNNNKNSSILNKNINQLISSSYNNNYEEYSNNKEESEDYVKLIELLNGINFDYVANAIFSSLDSLDFSHGALEDDALDKAVNHVLSDKELSPYFNTSSSKATLRKVLMKFITSYGSSSSSTTSSEATNTVGSSSVANSWTLSQHNHARVFNEICIYITVLICLTGVVGNMLSLKVFCSTKILRTSSRCYLIALTISDAIFLLTHFIDSTCREIVDHWNLNLPINITDQKQSMCRSFALLRNVCRAASPWIIVTFTLERFLVVMFPSHSHVISRPVLAKRFVFIIIFLSVIVSLYAPIMSGLIQTPDAQAMKKMTKRLKVNQLTALLSTLPPLISNYYHTALYRKSCDVLANYRSIYLYFTIFYTIIVIILPLLIVSLFNTLLIMRLYRSNDQWMSTKIEMHEHEMSYKEMRDKKVQIENLKITWTLIIISASFILLTLPFVIMYFIDRFYVKSTPAKAFVFYAFTKSAELFYIFNHSINFFLYVLSRNSFRRVLKEKLKCDCCFPLKNYHATTLSTHLVINHNIELKPRSINLSSHKSASRSDHNLELRPPNIEYNAIPPESYEKYWENFDKQEQIENEKQRLEVQNDVCLAENNKNAIVLKFDLLKKRMKTTKTHK